MSVSMQAVQQQKGGTDCGLFAIAFATELCFGGDPCAVQFNQADLRNHLKMCFEEMKISSFPKFADAPATNRCKRTETAVRLHCYCHMPQQYDQMVLCNKCSNMWCHLSCLGLAPNQEPSFYCWLCVNKERPMPVKRPACFEVPAATAKKRSWMF